MKGMQYFNAKFTSLLPKYSKGTLRKGESGKIGVVGGSFEFVGAPFFSGMSAMRSVY